MLQFLIPIAFIGLAALAVPLLIHLWSRGVGPRVQVGSLRFLEETERRQLRRLRLSQLPLLLLRMALLALLVALLARPVWVQRSADGAGAPEHLVLIHPDVLRHADRADAYQTVDALAADSAAVRLLAPGFPEADFDAPPPDPASAGETWSLLREADAGLPEGSALTVVGAGRLGDFQGARPALGASVAWVDVAMPAPNRWVAAARQLGGDSLLVTVGRSGPAATRFAQVPGVPNAAGVLQGADGLTLEYDAERQRVVLRPPDAYPEDDTRAVAAADTAQPVVVFHSPARRDDARYVTAALRAVAQVERRALEIVTTADAATSAVGAALVFWLHDAPPPEALTALVAGGSTLVSDAEGEAEQAVLRHLVGIDRLVDVRRRVAARHRGAVLWRDSAGEPLLEREAEGEGTRYRFYSRFHPTAGTLVHSAAFPAWISTLLHPEEAEAASADRRRITVAQRLPRHHAGVMREPRPTTMYLHRPLWWFIVLLFGAERWVAHRHAGKRKSTSTQ